MISRSPALRSVPPLGAAAAVVRRAVAADAAAIAELHAEQFPDHVVSRLPRRLIARLFRDYMTTAVVLVAQDADSRRILGYALGGRLDRLDAVRRRFSLDHALRLAFCARASTLGSLLESAGTILGGRSGGGPALGPLSWQLRYIAVRPEARRRGTASALLAGLEAAIAPPAAEYHAWVYAGREDAVRFYERHGFEAHPYDGGHVLMRKRLQREADRLQTRRVG